MEKEIKHKNMKHKNMKHKGIKHKDMKEDILRALDGEKILLCPSCKNRIFLRTGNSRVEITEQDDSILDTMVDGFEEYNYVCAKCNEEVDIENMIKTTKLVFKGED